MIMQTRSSSPYIKIILLALSVAIGGGIAHYYFKAPETGGLVNYNPKQDVADVVKLFHNDWYWLSNREWDQNRLIETFAHNKPNEYEPKYFGKMPIEVLRENGVLVGVVTYYMKNFYEGAVLFLAINPEFRGKRYGEKLLNYAIDQLKKQGAKIITLACRVDNERGIKLYTRNGFKNMYVDNGFIHFQRDA